MISGKKWLVSAILLGLLAAGPGPFGTGAVLSAQTTEEPGSAGAPGSDGAGATAGSAESAGDALDFVEEDRDVFAPFVSRLRVAVRDPQVRLTWRDAEDLEGGSYRVFRHIEEITQETIDQATLVARVDPGTETYLDTPLEEGTYFYAVLAAGSEGRVYPIFVPFRNKTIRAVTVSRLETEEDLAASIYDIEAQVQDNAIVVRFEASRTGRDLVVYRSTTPFESVSDITGATLIDEFESINRRFADYPVPGVQYYYGVFDKALIERGSVEIDPGENTLAAPVSITMSGASDIEIQIPRATKRAAPLPILQLARGIQSGDRLARNTVPERSGRILGPDTEGAIRYLLALSPEPQVFRPNPVILPEEREVTGDGAERTLAQVVSTDFAAGNYATTAGLLENLLTLPLSSTMEDRVRFYLGQALYFDGRREPAFVEFLLARDGELYSQVKPWIDGILLPRG